MKLYGWTFVPDPSSYINRLRLKAAAWRANWRLLNLTRQVTAHARPAVGQAPVVVFNASARLTGLSQNAAFTLLTACGLQTAGIPIVYFACQAGMSRCVQGTDRDDHTKPPPCSGCISQSKRLFSHALAVPFKYNPDGVLVQLLDGLTIEQLSNFEFPTPLANINPLTQPSQTSLNQCSITIPLGSIVLPSLRWALRIHHLIDDEPTRFLLREYILSAYNVAKEFTKLLEQLKPTAVVVFNGILFPEASARWVAQQQGIRVITHEVGFQPFSSFFSDGQATAYPIHIPDDFDLSVEQNARLDAYFEKRFKGQFTMAGIRFWPEMRGLDDAFLQKVAKFRQVVPIFTNVIYDTSQIHANTVFPHMFAWLNLVLKIIRDHKDTLFIIRAHPDEMRPGTRKQSRESVQGWIEQNQVNELPNVVFINSQEYLSSYELIQRAKFIMVYNSSIGLEAALMGVAVLCGGKARFTQYPTVFFPATPKDYLQKAEEFLATPGPITIPDEFSRNARRFIYYQLYRASLPFGEFIEAYPRPGYVQVRSVTWQQLSGQHSPTMRVLVDGVLHGDPFLLPEN